MSGERQGSAGGSPPPAGLSRWLFYAAYGLMFLFLFLGPTYFGTWLYQPYATALRWGPNGWVLPVAGTTASILLFRCAPFNRGWRGALPGFVAAAAGEITLIANMVAVAVLLRAISPDAASGSGGLITVFIIAFVVTLPVTLGGIRLTERWQAANEPLREWFRNKNFRRQTVLGVVFGFISMAPVMLTEAMIERGLLAAYPAVEKSVFAHHSSLGLAVLFTFTGTAPFDLRSALRSAVAALVVFETGIAAHVAVTLAAITLHIDSLWLLFPRILPVMFVFGGAVMLLAHKHGVWGDEASNPRPEEAAEA